MTLLGEIEGLEVEDWLAKMLKRTHPGAKTMVITQLKLGAAVLLRVMCALQALPV